MWNDGRQMARWKWLGVVGCVAVLVWLAGCDRNGPSMGGGRSGGSKSAAVYAAQADRLATADVAADVQAAMATGDDRFVAVMGVGLMVPGVPDYHENYADRGVRMIENTSDIIENEEHLRLQLVAGRYAEQYNQLLLARLEP